MDRTLDLLVRSRAGERCEYCLLPQFSRRLRFQIDHVIAEQHRGATAADNLALCCGRCNRHKGPNVGGIDPITRLFHPRVDRWAEHFLWHGTRLDGRTPEGRVTVYVLDMNTTDDLDTRAELLAAGLFPP